MDPHWNNFNQPFGRLPPVSGVPGNPALNRFDLPILDPAALTSGLSGLTQPLPAHSTLSPPRPLSSLAGYSHHPMSQFLDPLSQGFPSQSPYKTVPVGQPAFSLDSAGRGTPDARLSSNKNVFPETLIQPTKESYHPTVASPMMTTQNTESKGWGLSNFLPAPPSSTQPSSNSYSNIAPPPAHSGSRPSTIQHTPYHKTTYDEPSLKSHYADPLSKSDRYRSAHKVVYMDPSPKIGYSEPIQKTSYSEPLQKVYTDTLSKFGYNDQAIAAQKLYSDQAQQKVIYENPQVKVYQEPSKASYGSVSSKSHYDNIKDTIQEKIGYSEPIHKKRYTEPILSTPSPVPSQSPSSYIERSRQQEASQMSYNNSSTPHNNGLTISSAYSNYGSISAAQYNMATSNSNIYTSSGNNYDPVSPVGQMPDSQTTVEQQSFGGMSLQDLADISSNQQKIPLTPSPFEQQQHIVDTNTLQHNPGPMHHQQPANVGSPPIASSRMSTVPQAMPIQAVADSTTKKSKRSGKRKKKVQETKESVPVQPVAPMPVVNPDNYTRIEAQHQVHQPAPIPPVTALVHPMEQSMQVNPMVSMVQQYQQQQEMMHAETTQEFQTTSEAMAMYMTSGGFGEFVNPNDILAENMPLVVQNDPNIQHEMEVDERMMYEEQEYYSQPSKPKKRSKTKAEQKMMPAALLEEEDDEFTHLKSPPVVTKNQNTAHKKANPSPPKPQNPPPAPPKVAPKPQSDFQNSFLSFIQGKKPETLSSVNSEPTVKPKLPKYVPMDTPRRPPEKTSVSVVSFSDEDDDNESTGSIEDITNTVKSVISNLGPEDDKEDSPSTSAEINPFGGSILKQMKSSNKKKLAGAKAKKKSKQSNIALHILDAAESVPSPPQIRQSIKRSAKEKSEQKKKEKERKKKRKKGDGSDLSDAVDVSDDDFVQVSSEDEAENYDSDKDPGWTPFGEDTVRKYSSDEEGGSKSAKRARQRSRRSSKSTSRRRSAVFSSHRSPSPEPVVIISDDDEDGEYVHSYQRGDFVINKKDLQNYDNYPIWRLDAGRLLQKFEAVHEDDRVVHKAMSTYSSWSDSMKNSYKAVRVRIVYHSKDGDVVEVLEKYRPKPADGSVEVNEEDPFLEAFNVYLQILISQSLHPDFIDIIKESGDDFYLEPLQKVTSELEEHKQSITGTLNWSQDFKAVVEKCPYINVMNRVNSVNPQSCQASIGSSAPAVKSVQLYGDPYNRGTLQSTPNSDASKEFHIGEEASKCLEVYHRLHHFMFTVYKRCCAKVEATKDSKADMEDNEVLDTCLQNRKWVLKLFTDLKSLLNKAKTVKSSSTIVTLD